MVTDEIRTFDFHLKLPELAPARYCFTAGLADGDLSKYQPCDIAENAVSLLVLPGEKPVSGYIQFPCQVSAQAMVRPG